LAIPLGCFLGLILMALLFVPYLRKAGAYTMPGFFYLRFSNTTARGLAALLLIVPSFMLLHAEVTLGSNLLEHFLPPPHTLAYDFLGGSLFRIMVLTSVLFTVLAGGMRSATWAQCAQFIGLLGLLLPLLSVSVLKTNLPLPQLTYGSQIEEVRAQENLKGTV